MPRPFKPYRGFESDEGCVARFGCTSSQFESANPLSVPKEKRPHFSYMHQRKNARARGIEWRFNFWTWWQVWISSGKWSERGCKFGQYVMTRRGDSGPYSAENVSIATNTQNALEARIKDCGPRAAPSAVEKVLRLTEKYCVSDVLLCRELGLPSFYVSKIRRGDVVSPSEEYCNRIIQRFEGIAA